MSEIGRWPIDEPFPAVLRDADLMLVLGLKHSRYCLLKRRGLYRFLQTRPQIEGQGTLYSGALVRAWVEGKPKRAQRAAPRSSEASL